MSRGWEDEPNRTSSEHDYSYISGAASGRRKVVYARIGASAIFEGDIILGSIAEMEAAKRAIEDPSNEPLGVAIVPGSRFRWPGGVIPHDVPHARREPGGAGAGVDSGQTFY
jgi:hypothetical protein